MRTKRNIDTGNPVTIDAQLPFRKRLLTILTASPLFAVTAALVAWADSWIRYQLLLRTAEAGTEQQVANGFRFALAHAIFLVILLFGVHLVTGVAFSFLGKRFSRKQWAVVSAASGAVSALGLVLFSLFFSPWLITVETSWTVVFWSTLGFAGLVTVTTIICFAWRDYSRRGVVVGWSGERGLEG